MLPNNISSRKGRALYIKYITHTHIHTRIYICICIDSAPPSPAALAAVAELGLLTELTTVLLPLGGALDDEEEEDRPPSTESSSSKFLSATTEAKMESCACRF